MTQKNQIYKCSVCGNIVEILHVGASSLVCCGKPMELQEPNSSDGNPKTHIPVIEVTATGVKIKVGSEPHPMEEDHHIEWVEIMVGEYVDRKYLKPGDAPEAEFNITGDGLIARAYCNIHGLWKSE